MYNNYRILGLRRKAQIFSIDVLLALLPVMLIIGASLQYLYLGQEDMKSMSQRNSLEVMTQGLSDRVLYDRSAINITPNNCLDFETLLNDSTQDNVPPGFVYHVRIRDYYGGSSDLCDSNSNHLWSSSLSGTGGGKDAIFLSKATASSEERFVVQSDDDGELLPGHIAGVSFSVWES